MNEGLLHPLAASRGTSVKSLGAFGSRDGHESSGPSSSAEVKPVNNSVGIPNFSSSPVASQASGLQKRLLRLNQKFKANTWLYEISATLASLLCLGAIVVILASMQNKPLDRWTAVVSINAMVATLTTAAKAFLLYSVAVCLSQLKWIYLQQPRKLFHLQVLDDLSRGPLGAVQTLFQIRWAPAYLGILIVLLALAVDPFTQQVVSFEPQNVVRNDSAVSFGYSLNYTASAHRNELNSLVDTDVGIQGAILKGLFGPRTPPVYDCSSNCTWQGSFPSLGFASTCRNVTAATLPTKKCTGNKQHLCFMTTPGNLSMGTFMAPETWSTSLDFRVNHSLPEYNNGSQPISPDFLTIGVLKAPKDVYLTSQNQTGEDITECVVSLVGYNYTNVSATGTDFKTAPLTPIPLGNATSINAFLIFRHADLPDLAINFNDLLALADFFVKSPLFIGSIFSGKPIGAAEGSDTGVRLPLLNADVASKLDDMAASMTDYIRAGPGSQRARGYRIATAIYVRVQWAWLLVLLFEVLAGVTLLLWTMVWTRKMRPLGLWRESALALLFSRYEGGGAEELLRLDPAGPEHVEDIARSVKVRLA